MLGRQPSTDVIGPGALPDNRIVKGTAGIFIAQHGRFTLIGDTDRDQVTAADAGFSDTH